MAGKDVDELCHRWFVEYDCWRMWTVFSQFGSVDDIVNANRASLMNPRQYAVNTWNHDDGKADQYRLLVSFMCKISEAANEELADGNTQHDVSPQQTTLEDAIDLFDEVSRCYREILKSGERNDVKLCLKRQAVLAPLRKNDRTLAKVKIFSFPNIIYTTLCSMQ